MKLLRKISAIALALLFAASLQAQPFSTMPYNPYDETFSESCTTILVGKRASSDGSVMTAHSCDSNYRTWLTMEKPIQYKAGETEPIFWGRLHTDSPSSVKGVKEMGQIPAPEKQTFRFFNTAYPSMNEKQLAIGEATLQSKNELVNTKGLFQIEELERLALQRCSTARDAIKLMGELAEKYGYGDDGECLTVADKNEAWAFEIYGTGAIKEDGSNEAAKQGSPAAQPVKKGKKMKAGSIDWTVAGAIWVAKRIPDDHIYINANTSRISTVDFSDSQNTLYSKDLKERMKYLGLWDGKEEFKLYKMVSNQKSFGTREYFLMNKLAPSLGLKFDSEEIPFSIKPDVKMTPEIMFSCYRETYEGTNFDQTKELYVDVPRRKMDENGKSISYTEKVFPVSSFMPSDLRSLLNKLKPGCAPRTRTVAVIQCSYSHVTRLRSWMPDEIGAVSYFSFDNPAQSPRIPIYAGETKLPKGFDLCGQWKYSNDAAIWAYRETNRIATINWGKTRNLVESNVAKYESLMMEQSAQIEAKAAELIKAGKRAEAVELLNNFTEEFANATSKAWFNLKGDLWIYFARSL